MARRTPFNATALSRSSHSAWTATIAPDRYWDWTLCTFGRRKGALFILDATKRVRYASGLWCRMDSILPGMMGLSEDGRAVPCLQT